MHTVINHFHSIVKGEKKIKNLYMLQQPTLLDKMKLLSYLVLKKCWQSVYTYSSFLFFFFFCQSHFQTKIDRFIHDWLYDKLASIYQLKGFCWCLNSTIFFIILDEQIRKPTQIILCSSNHIVTDIFQF